MYYGYPPYESVADKTKKAEKIQKRLIKKGEHIAPIEAFRGGMASTFWGKSWCKNLESYADYENRLGRGRSYVRAGCVCHLDIQSGAVKAYVSGSRLYTVTLTISPLPKARWEKVCASCSGQVISLIDILQGKLSKNVMEIMCHTATGIFPSPKEIALHCSCPDSANMCKHVTAALYGVGRRLDAAPELLFLLRGVKATELIATSLDFTPALQTENLGEQSLGDIFGIDITLDAKGDAADTPRIALTGIKPAKTPTKPAKPQKSSVNPPFNPQKPTGASIKKLRVLSGLAPADFARTLGVSFATLRTWFTKKGVLTLRADSLSSLILLQERLLGDM